jgi:hypothetical protein
MRISRICRMQQQAGPQLLERARSRGCPGSTASRARCSNTGPSSA